MPSFNLDDLTAPVTRAEAQASIYEVLGILGVNTASWKPGAVVRTMIVACSVVLSTLSQLQQKIARSGFLELSEGDWLTLVAHYVYDVERIEATFATGEITLTNAGGGVYSFDPDDLIFRNPVTDKTYRNTASVTLGALGAATVTIQATEAGVDSTSGPGEISVMVTTVLGVSCSNAAQVTGSDAETDAALRSRCQQKLGALSPFGPWDAYAYAVRTATHEDGTSIGVTRIRITKDGYGNVTTYLANVDGEVPGDVDDITTDLGIAFDAIQKKAAPLAVNAIVESAVANPIQIAYEVWLYDTSALSTAEIEDVIEDALTAFMQAQPIGGNVIGSDPGKIFVTGIRNAIFDALPEIFSVNVTIPAADIEFTPAEVAVIGTIELPAIHQEPPPEGFGGTL